MTQIILGKKIQKNFHVNQDEICILFTNIF